MKLPDLEMDLLRAFVAVAEAGSFTAAAERVGRTQSAVSQKILRLEEALQMRVSERTSRSLTLTRDGERVLVAVRRLLDQYESFLREVFEPPNVSVLRLGVAENLLQAQLPNFLARLKSLYRDVQLELTTDSSQHLLKALEQKKLDVAIVGVIGKTSARRSRVVWSEPLVWVAGAGFRDEPRYPAKLVMMQPPCIYREIIADSLASARREWTPTCTVSNLGGMQAAILGGLGVTVLSRSQVRDGMRVMPASRNWPALPPIKVEVMGDRTEIQHMIPPLVSLLQESLEMGLATNLETSSNPAQAR
ncbi:LysR family transcriptional regulator [Burkholderia sp. Ax-1724]|uniref:LysR family transcriptional regulator n=1 Tax=Burkholderia sp. Ax-1724 TaxID=2608336 RepID=UPI00142368F3|nr:LysR family transcriptional regulator [Burkholderia sp. Ax-1724]NIF50843.1 LysR family transcriptional regulator [Burkholderia sp. Ax-1724]